MAATKLQESGYSVTVIDKGRNYGGRMATRVFDDGVLTTALNFLPYENLTKTYVDKWHADIIKIWFESASNRSEKHPRWIAPRGMNSLPKHIAKDLQFIYQLKF